MSEGQYDDNFVKPTPRKKSLTVATQYPTYISTKKAICLYMEGGHAKLVRRTVNIVTEVLVAVQSLRFSFSSHLIFYVQNA